VQRYVLHEEAVGRGAGERAAEEGEEAAEKGEGVAGEGAAARATVDLALVTVSQPRALAALRLAARLGARNAAFLCGWDDDPEGPARWASRGLPGA
jgi:hypothetical protein